ncbi:glycosyltransferase family 2 protein [Mucilaginibacter myungsuensis]|uniref:Glycosyltransferase family 2 protein n=1 Tax=Mucilaginibacter myungsuensis TaxID=649104 RepID=A0A929KZZ8_9SPHI|nr:glycosyltransferase family 2 protein [Mucilaginibacter myungsuensis]MBE9663737.1 glycosyltransferase family 2 protein [Mucilaginibacter myungsuensis]MDN3598939.1 glycosyltransferase family 2 protein [Mucilaginibacter myungsuensis]
MLPFPAGCSIINSIAFFIHDIIKNMPNISTCALLIPTYNAGKKWPEVLASIDKQIALISRKIIIDSGSKDNTVALAKAHGFEVFRTTSSQFNHGGTRQRLVDESADADVCVFLTQDAILTDENSLSNIVCVFNDPEVGMAYGRQLPHIDAKPLEIHARVFNYPENSHIISIADQPALGFKAFFCSNSFAAYRKNALNAIGGFPTTSIMGEDAIVAAKMLKAGYKKAYVAEAMVRHSHSYSLLEEYRRYFDTRVFHEQNIWMLEEYGKPTGEGLKFIRSEISYAIKKSPVSLFRSISSIFAKWLGYNSARFYKIMPLFLIKKFSMHSFYWK